MALKLRYDAGSVRLIVRVELEKFFSVSIDNCDLELKKPMER